MRTWRPIFAPPARTGSREKLKLGLGVFRSPPSDHPSTPMSDEPQESQDLHTELGSPAPLRDGRQKSARDQRSSLNRHNNSNNHNSQNNPNHHWRELQELRSRLAEHEETVERLKSAFGMISCALSPCPDSPPMETFVGGHRSNEEQSSGSNRPGRRGRSNNNMSHYRTNTRGGASGGYQGYRGAHSGFRGSDSGFRS